MSIYLHPYQQKAINVYIYIYIGIGIQTDICVYISMLVFGIIFRSSEIIH